MQQPPKIEFPQYGYPIKIIGENAAGFSLRQHVVACVGRHIAGWQSDNSTLRRSSRGNYLAVSVCCDIDSLKQLEALCHDLRSHPRVRLVL